MPCAATALVAAARWWPMKITVKCGESQAVVDEDLPNTSTVRTKLNDKVVSELLESLCHDVSVMESERLANED